LIQVNRRYFVGALVGSTALGLSACGGSLSQAFQTAAQYAQAAADAALALVPDLTVVGVSDAVTKVVTTAAAALSAAAKALAGVAPDTGSIYKQIASAVSAVASALVGLPGLPGVVMGALEALQAIVPAIGAILGVVGVSAARATLSGPRAYATLRAYATR